MQKTKRGTPANAKPRKLSKWAEWWLKHPEGSDLRILDMKAVLR
jgi:hypothetical protein